MRVRLLASALLILTAACASSGAPRPRGSRDLLTQEEIAATEVLSAYEAVQRLRPSFLQGRGSTSVRNPSPTLPVVYLNGLRAGGVETLRSIQAREVLEIRYVNASDATTRYGTGHTGGVLEVKTVR